MNYTAEELHHHALTDLLNDANQSAKQALAGPYYPDRGITAQSLLAYAKKCRQTAAHYAAHGNAHLAVLNGAPARHQEHAALIAASPALLAALEDCASVLQSIDAQLNGKSFAVTDVLTKARSAISKATPN